MSFVLKQPAADHEGATSKTQTGVTSETVTQAHLRKATARPAQIAVVLVLALWFGFLAGFMEVGFHLIQRSLGNYWFLFRCREFLWVTPLIDAAILLGPGAAIILLCILFPKRSWVRLSVLVFSSYFYWKALVLFGGLHWAAITLLVVGLSIQTIRLLPQWRIMAIYPFLRRTALLSALLIVVLGVSIALSENWREQQQQANLPPARANAANVLVVVWDTVRAKNLSLYGHHRRTTPHLERWAQKGAWFRHAMAPAPWTLPTHASMFTGRYPQEHSATYTTPLDATHPTLAERLKQRGYLTAAFVANKWFASYETGLNRGFLHYEDYRLSLGEAAHCSILGRKIFESDLVRHTFEYYDTLDRKNAGEINQAFSRWLDHRPKDRPFFAFVNYYDAHFPYLPPPAPFDRKFAPQMSADYKHFLCRFREAERCNCSPAAFQLAEDLYDCNIAYMDNQLDQLLTDLQRRRILDNTIVIITSDHGEHFGEHEMYSHAHSLFRPLIHVPLVVIYPPSVPKEFIVDEFVTLRDLAATVQDLAKTGAAGGLPGNSWRQYWDESVPENRRSNSPVLQVTFYLPPNSFRPNFGCSPAALGSLASLFHNGKYYIKNVKTGDERIYDFASDRLETRNLAAGQENKTLVENFRLRLNRVLEQYRSRWTDFP